MSSCAKELIKISIPPGSICFQTGYRTTSFASATGRARCSHDCGTENPSGRRSNPLQLVPDLRQLLQLKAV